MKNAQGTLRGDGKWLAYLPPRKQNASSSRLGLGRGLLAFCLVCLFLSSAVTYGQTVYSGGSGDGYGRSFFIYFKGDPPGFTPTQVYPTTVAQGAQFTVRAEQVHNKLEILVWNIQGQPIHRNVAWNVEGSQDQRIGTQGWSAGVYLIDVRVDGRAYRHKLIVMRE